VLNGEPQDVFDIEAIEPVPAAAPAVLR
jgi:hypothetical protein